MALIIITGGVKIASQKDRCARCKKTIQIEDQFQPVQVHYTGRFDYRFGAVHYPDCRK